MYVRAFTDFVLFHIWSISHEGRPTNIRFMKYFYIPGNSIKIKYHPKLFLTWQLFIPIAIVIAIVFSFPSSSSFIFNKTNSISYYFPIILIIYFIFMWREKKVYDYYGHEKFCSYLILRGKNRIIHEWAKRIKHVFSIARNFCYYSRKRKKKKRKALTKVLPYTLHHRPASKNGKYQRIKRKKRKKGKKKKQVNKIIAVLHDLGRIHAQMIV